jgi:hypothetical protein
MYFSLERDISVDPSRKKAEEIVFRAQQVVGQRVAARLGQAAK